MNKNNSKVDLRKVPKLSASDVQMNEIIKLAEAEKAIFKSLGVDNVESDISISVPPKGNAKGTFGIESYIDATKRKIVLPEKDL